MKKLILIRHAEAEPASGNIRDFNRSLTTSGKRDAAKMAALLLNKGSVPQVIISSSAPRALTTAQIFTTTVGLKQAETNAEIYEATADTLLQIVNNLNEQYNIVALTGHNPGVSNLLYQLTSKITTMPTSAFAEIELEVDTWAEVSSDFGKLTEYCYP